MVPRYVPVARNESATPAHTLVVDAVTDTVGVKPDDKLIVTEFDVAVVGEAQASDDVSVHVTTAPLVSDELINVPLLVPAFVPLTFHWYEGLVPPFVITDVNVSADPLHILVELAVIAIVGV